MRTPLIMIPVSACAICWLCTLLARDACINCTIPRDLHIVERCRYIAHIALNKYAAAFCTYNADIKRALRKTMRAKCTHKGKLSRMFATGKKPSTIKDNLI